MLSAHAEQGADIALAMRARDDGLAFRHDDDAADFRVLTHKACQQRSMVDAAADIGQEEAAEIKATQCAAAAPNTPPLTAAPASKMP